MGRLDGKVAIVTGGGSGIGAATCHAMAAAGARVVVADIDTAAAHQVAQALASAGAAALAVPADVTQEADVAALVARTVEAFGRLDVMHNNAGGASAGDDGGVATLDLATWERAMALNARSAMLGCKHAVTQMLRQGTGGSIINTASAAGAFGNLDRTAYGAAKAAVLTLTRYVATQHGKDGIRCNAIVPGLVLTPAARAFVPPDKLARIENTLLTPYAGQPDDIAQAAVFLASNDSRYITGQHLWLDGGTSARSQIDAAEGAAAMQWRAPGNPGGPGA